MSPMIWISTWRERGAKRSRNTVSSPNAPAASRRAPSTPPLELAGRLDQPHALAAAAGAGLDQQRVADRLGHRASASPASPSRRWPGSTGTPASSIRSRASVFEPIASIASGAGPIQVRPGVGHRARERRVLGQEAVAGVDRVGARVAARPATTASARRYESAGAGPPMATARSASRTNGASASASEYTATVPMPSRRQVRKTRRAISPRLATRTRSARLHPEDAEALGALRPRGCGPRDSAMPSTVRVSRGSMIPSS